MELAFSPNPGLKSKVFFYRFYIGNLKNLRRVVKIRSTGLQKPRAGTVFIFTNFSPKQHLHEPCSGILARATTEPAESLIEKFYTKNEILKSK
jgi:hypothetical protein